MYDSLIIIPAYNEEKNIGKVLSEIRNLNLEADVLVVNDGSHDRTEDVVCRENVQVVSLPYNLGYGGALQTGFKYAVKMGYKYVVQFDSDGQHDPNDINIILDKLKADDVDVVIGSRFLIKDRIKIGIMKNAAISMFRFLIRHLSGKTVTDPTSGLKGLKRSVFSYFSMMGKYPADYPDADIVIQMIRFRFKVAEVPANIRKRNEGRSMHSGLKPVYYFIKIILCIIINLLREKVLNEGGEFNG